MATVAVTHFSDRLADAVERKQQPARRRARPGRRAAAGGGRRRSLRVLLRHRRRGRAVRGRGEAAVGVLRGARRRRRARLCAGLRVRARRRPARHRRREARRHRLDRARVRAGVHPARRRGHGQPVSRRRLHRAVSRGVPARRRRDLLPREDVEPGQRRRAGRRARGRAHALAARCASSSRGWGEELVGERGLSAVGAVVGATFPREVAEARELLPRSVLLLPGIGAQGGTPADVAAAFAAGPASALVSASRSVIYASRKGAATGAPPPVPRPSASRARSGVPPAA